QLHIGETPRRRRGRPGRAVWVTDKERSLVYRIYGPRAAVTDSFPAGPGAYSLARSGDAMWITSFAGSDMRSFVP
ncbi:MAG TPA: hypothetical protein VIG93_01345, partial [Gaiellaceae bacterium]